eukprot:5384398-Amphidinium_carterae.1
MPLNVARIASNCYVIHTKLGVAQDEAHEEAQPKVDPSKEASSAAASSASFWDDEDVCMYFFTVCKKAMK